VLCTILVEKLGITTVEDVNAHTVGSLGLVTNYTSSPTSWSRSSNLDVFKLTESADLPPTFMIVGMGFNLLNDEIKPKALFQVDALRESNYGFNLPQGMTMSAVQETAIYMQHFTESREYVTERLRQLGIGNAVDVNIFKMKPKTGFSFNTPPRKTRLPSSSIPSCTRSVFSESTSAI